LQARRHSGKRRAHRRRFIERGAAAVLKEGLLGALFSTRMLMRRLVGSSATWLFGSS
jgi:hypothetical protein